MAITGVSSISGQQIIAAGALSAASAGTALYDANGKAITSYLTAVPEGYATTADLTGKQNVLTFGYDVNNAISSINESAIAGGSTLTGDYVSGYNVVVKPGGAPSEWQSVYYSAVEVSGDVKLKTWMEYSGHEDAGHVFENEYSLYNITQSTGKWDGAVNSFSSISANILTNSPKGTIKTEGHKLEATISAISGNSYTMEGNGTKFYVSALPGYPYSKYTITPTGDSIFEVYLNYGTSEYEMYGSLFFNDGLPHDLPATSGGKDLMWVQPNNCAVVAGEEQVVELALKNDLPTYEYDSSNKISAINGSAIAGGASDEEVNTLVHTNSATWNTVSDKLDTTAFSDVSGTFLTAHQDLSNYATTASLADKLDTTAFSTVSGNFLTAVDLTPYQTTAGMTAYMTTGDSANFYTTANESGFITGVPNAYLQNTDLTITDNKVTEISGIPLAGGEAVPTGIMVESGLEYDNTEISGYSGSAFKDVALTDVVTANSGVWGGSALPISAGPGIKLEIVNDTLVASMQGPILNEITIAGTWNGREVKQLLQSGTFETNVNTDVIPVNSAYSAASSKWIDPSNSYILYGSTANILPSNWVLGATGRLGSLVLLNGIVRVRSNDTTNTQCTAFVTIKWCEN